MEKYNNNIFSNIEEITQMEQISEIDLFENKPKIIINFKKSSENILYDFINKNPEQINIYIGNNHKINIDIIDMNFELYLFFLECVDKSVDSILNTVTKNTDIENLFKLNNYLYNWNFCIFQNIMFNYPFTLSDVIFIPINYLMENFQNKNIQNIARTIIHEKIHIIQRYNEKYWEYFISIKDKNWIKLNNSDIRFQIIKNNVTNKNTINTINLINSDEEFINNPDTYYDNFKYIYKINGDFYYGHYVYNKIKKNIYIKYFKLDLDKKKLFTTNFKFQEDHPYEKYAYELSEIII